MGEPVSDDEIVALRLRALDHLAAIDRARDEQWRERLEAAEARVAELEAALDSLGEVASHSPHREGDDLDRELDNAANVLATSAPEVIQKRGSFGEEYQ